MISHLSQYHSPFTDVLKVRRPAHMARYQLTRVSLRNALGALPEVSLSENRLTHHERSSPVDPAFRAMETHPVVFLTFLLLCWLACWFVCSLIFLFVEWMGWGPRRSHVLIAGERNCPSASCRSGGQGAEVRSADSLGVDIGRTKTLNLCPVFALDLARCGGRRGETEVHGHTKGSISRGVPAVPGPIFPALVLVAPSAPEFLVETCETAYFVLIP